MKSQNFIRKSLLAFIIVLTSAGLLAQNEKTKAYVPHVGQAGKDVIWVPTPDALVKKMLEIAKVTPKDNVVDLGSGDGRTVIAAAKLGANAVGIEYNGDMVELSRKKAEEEGVSDKAKFIQADLFQYDLSNADVITMFLLPDINLKLRPKILDLKPGTRVVSNTFTMGEWTPDQEVTINESTSWNTALLWIVPAKVQGTWKLGDGELTLNQEFQKFYGSYKDKNKTSQVTDGKIEGTKVTFKIGGTTYTGQVTNNNTITGTYNNNVNFTATKVQ
jgi:SAM-dependent methyltransferase